MRLPPASRAGGNALQRSTEKCPGTVDLRESTCLVSGRSSRFQASPAQIKPPQSIVLSCEQVPGAPQPSEFGVKYVQIDGWGAPGCHGGPIARSEVCFQEPPRCQPAYRHPRRRQFRAKPDEFPLMPPLPPRSFCNSRRTWKIWRKRAGVEFCST